MELLIKQYKGFKIHVVNGQYKYDIYDGKYWYTSVNSMKDAKLSINAIIWAWENNK